MKLCSKCANTQVTVFKYHIPKIETAWQFCKILHYQVLEKSSRYSQIPQAQTEEWNGFNRHYAQM